MSQEVRLTIKRRIQLPTVIGMISIEIYGKRCRKCTKRDLSIAAANSENTSMRSVGLTNGISKRIRWRNSKLMRTQIVRSKNSGNLSPKITTYHAYLIKCAFLSILQKFSCSQVVVLNKLITTTSERTQFRLLTTGMDWIENVSTLGMVKAPSSRYAATKWSLFSITIKKIGLRKDPIPCCSNLRDLPAPSQFSNSSTMWNE